MPAGSTMTRTSRPRNIMIIGAASGTGAPDPGCAEGPDALRRYRVFHDSPLQHVEWDVIRPQLRGGEAPGFRGDGNRRVQPLP